MRHIQTTLSALLLASGLLTASAYAQEAAVVPTPTGPTQEKTTPPIPGTPEHAAQLQREHKRAVLAGDHANDPLNSASSDALNQQEAAKALASGTGPSGYVTVPDGIPVPPSEAPPLPPVSTVPSPVPDTAPLTTSDQPSTVQ